MLYIFKGIPFSTIYYRIDLCDFVYLNSNRALRVVTVLFLCLYFTCTVKMAVTIRLPSSAFS